MNRLSRIVMISVVVAVLDEAHGQSCLEWVQRQVAGPGPTYGHAMAFDSARAVTVLHGGIPVNWEQTWEWDGDSWALRSNGGGPADRALHAMAYDAARGQTVLFSGWHSDCPNCGFYSLETWLWDGQVWTLGPFGPWARKHHAMVYDSRRRVSVMFGGKGFGLFGDTWEMDGQQWVERQIVGPSARRGHQMAFDESRGVTVLFGGVDGFSYLDDTWEFDGQTWQLVDRGGPPPRIWHTMAYDSARGTVVMHGGWNPTVVLDDLWEWDGSEWTQIEVAGGPSGRYTHTMVFDSARDTLVLFGGLDANNNALDDTWELGLACYPDCDQSTGCGTLDIFDFLCFQNSFVNADPYACDCDTSTGNGVCDIFDFLCFQSAFVSGCP